MYRYVKVGKSTYLVLWKYGKTVPSKLKMGKFHFPVFIFIYHVASLPYRKETTQLIL